MFSTCFFIEDVFNAVPKSRLMIIFVEFVEVERLDEKRRPSTAIQQFAILHR
jgi:hypothetical protein